MSRIRGKDTKPELLIRKGLFARGFRYRLHQKELPGKPDLVLRRYGAVIFVHGCFWHGHDCHLFTVPKSNTEFWSNKIRANCARDEANRRELLAGGWRVLEVWECAIRGKHRMSSEAVIEVIAGWLRSEQTIGSVRSVRGGSR
jgi:DNA mismatch endonuclease (patch repair protein)